MGPENFSVQEVKRALNKNNYKALKLTMKILAEEIVSRQAFDKEFVARS